MATDHQHDHISDDDDSPQQPPRFFGSRFHGELTDYLTSVQQALRVRGRGEHIGIQGNGNFVA